jgi:hypothetical protein
MYKDGPTDDHQKFVELCALAQAGALSSQEREELECHLDCCDSCREVYNEYLLISDHGMRSLASLYSDSAAAENWDEGPTRQRLFQRIRRGGKEGPWLVSERSQPGARYRAVAVGLAACLLAVVGIAAYQLGNRAHEKADPSSSAALVLPQELNSESARKAAQGLLDAQATQVAQLQKQVTVDQQELSRLHTASRAADDSFVALSTASDRNQEQLRQISEQRDKLASQLHEVEQAYQNVQVELTSLRAEHDRVLLHTTSLESKTEELTAAAREQERKLRDDEQFLSSDRDIRELMGARKLYIADVFDVDSRSRTRKPFGRVFYTQNKSLIFYAFDLEHEPGVKSASAFQVWGQRDAEQGDKARPTNLGLLYMDSETNRRWVLRFDDPKQLAEIDAVFVTVEPHGGSQKPTGKPLLYALLRKEANHP